MTKSWNDLADLQAPDYSTYNNLLIVDANNLSYRWLQRANYSSFDTDFIRTIQSLAKSYEAAQSVEAAAPASQNPPPALVQPPTHHFTIESTSTEWTSFTPCGQSSL